MSMYTNSFKCSTHVRLLNINENKCKFLQQSTSNSHMHIMCKIQTVINIHQCWVLCSTAASNIRLSACQKLSSVCKLFCYNTTIKIPHSIVDWYVLKDLHYLPMSCVLATNITDTIYRVIRLRWLNHYDAIYWFIPWSKSYVGVNKKITINS